MHFPLRGLFLGDFFVLNHTGTRKKVLENKVSKWYLGLYFQRIFYDFFPNDVFSAKINFRNPLLRLTCGFGMILAFTFMICDVNNANIAKIYLWQLKTLKNGIG